MFYSTINRIRRNQTIKLKLVVELLISSELEDLILAVTQFLEDTTEFALLHTSLLTRNSSDLFRGSTHANLDLLLQSRRANMLLDKVSVDIANTSSPARARFVDEVDDIKGIGVFLLECVKLFAEEDIFLGEVAVDELELGLVSFVGEGVGE
jgi:hypothetical protein